jgi:hypothetical protein
MTCDMTSALVLGVQGELPWGSLCRDLEHSQKVLTRTERMDPTQVELNRWLGTHTEQRQHETSASHVRSKPSHLAASLPDAIITIWITRIIKNL